MEFTSLASLERLTGLAYFKPTGGNYAPFGNITMVKLDTAPKAISALLWKRGKGNLFRRDNVSVEPVFSLTTDQFATPVVDLLVMGTRAADNVQSSASATTTSFTAAKGKAYDIGKRGITITSVKVGATAKTLGTDFYVDDPNIPQSLISLNGVIILPATAAGIADADTVDVLYDTPALTREVYNAFTTLNRSGSMKIYLEDETGTDAREIWTMNCQLSVKSIGDFDPTKFRDVVLECAIFGSPVVTTRPN